MSDFILRLRVFVSCPGDVAEEREALEAAIKSLNEGVVGRDRAVIQSWQWGKDVIPQIGPNPQEVVDGQLPPYDIYLGILSGRFGTRTQGYGSGTEKEFRDAMARWGQTGLPWILFYCNDAPPVARTTKDSKQYTKVLRFRKELQSLGIVQGYTGVRGSDQAFYHHVRKHLEGLLIRLTSKTHDAVPKLHPDPRETTAFRLYSPVEFQQLDLDIFPEQLTSKTHAAVPQRRPAPGGTAAYQPYPPAEVETLERLTRERAGQSGTPAEDAKRQARIDDLAIRLKRSPTHGDSVVGCRLERILGKGNFGVVWQASDEKTQERRAVKVFDSDRLGLTTSLYHFRRGVRAMEHLNGIADRPPNVVKLYAAEASKLAFSMALLEDRDLSTIAARSWTLEKKLDVFQSICAAVLFAHAHQVIHRDIKPANIVIHAGQPVLTDFDIADLLFAKTQTAAGFGTVIYAAPEAIEGEGRGKKTVDIYSLGRLLHFLIIEKDPPLRFEETPKLADLEEKLDADHQAIAHIVRKCTMYNATDRYGRIEELTQDLARVRNEIAISQSGVAPSKNTARPVAQVDDLVWASRTGQDEIGAWAEIALDDVVQRLRWIPPGNFLMGSPPGEHGRDKDEGPQHEVTLAQGFWLFETACTQALYQAVMGSNPSKFQDPTRPVEWVSFEDVQTFLTVINARIPGLGLSLPSEAQWEYACRAGTVTPFSFGETIHPELANYDGDYPYRARDAKGLNRKETVSVGSLPPNPWGLYEMHGNVWEWVADAWHENYGAPTDGSASEGVGALRVVRGGSWFEGARGVRCAYRYLSSLDCRNDYLGFRCARVQARKGQ